MKPKRPLFIILPILFFTFLGLVVHVSPGITQTLLNSITFDNQSGEPAFVKLIGPTQNSVSVPNGAKSTVKVAPGEYYILTRYGSSPVTYTFAKGESFKVKQTATNYSIITITLHKVVNGNYSTRKISPGEFDTVAVSAVRPSGSEEQQLPSNALPQIKGNQSLQSPPTFTPLKPVTITKLPDIGKQLEQMEKINEQLRMVDAAKKQMQSISQPVQIAAKAEPAKVDTSRLRTLAILLPEYRWLKMSKPDNLADFFEHTGMSVKVAIISDHLLKTGDTRRIRSMVDDLFKPFAARFNKRIDIGLIPEKQIIKALSMGLMDCVVVLVEKHPWQPAGSSTPAEVRLIHPSDEVIRSVDEKYSDLKLAVISAGTYNDQAEDYKTLSVVGDMGQAETTAESELSSASGSKSQVSNSQGKSKLSDPMAVSGEKWVFKVLSLENTGKQKWQKAGVMMKAPYFQIKEDKFTFWRTKVEIKRKSPDQKITSSWIRLIYNTTEGNEKQSNAVACIPGAFGDAAMVGTVTITPSNPDLSVPVEMDLLFIAPKATENVDYMAVQFLDYPQVQVIPKTNP